MIAYLIVFAAAIAAGYLSWVRTPLKAFLNVYLPFLIFISTGGGITFHGVLITPSTAASFVILAAIFLRHQAKWRWHWMDVVLFLFIATTFYSDYHILPDFSISGADCVGLATVMVPPYLLGRYLLESAGARVAAIKRLIVVLCIVAVLSPYEYRMGINPFALYTTIIFNVPFGFFQQFRWGFARVGGPFNHAITAGIMYTSALIFQMWLISHNFWEKKFRKFQWLPGKKSTWLTLAILAGIWMSQSRGPWMGGALGFMLFTAGRAKNIRRGITKALLVTAVLLTVFYVVTDKYTDTGGSRERVSQDKENAVYRRQLIVNYMPVVKEGGWFGYGRYVPVVDGQTSIDNFYLFTALLYGYAGLLLMLILILGTAVKLLRIAWNARNREDATLALCLLGVVMGTASTLVSVYLAAQAVVLFFMIFGWAQAIDPKRHALRATVAEDVPTVMPRFAYRRVFS